MGDEADDILRSFKLSDEDKKKYSVVKAKFDAHFVLRTNVIYERAKFNRRMQQDGVCQHVYHGSIRFGRTLCLQGAPLRNDQRENCTRAT